MCKYLPAIFADAMRSGGGSVAARMLNTCEKHPELVWDTDAKERVSSIISRHKEELVLLFSPYEIVIFHKVIVVLFHQTLQSASF